MASSSGATSADPELLSFPANLSKHLTGLTLDLQSETTNVQHLHAICMLTALQKLRLGCDAEEWYRYDLEWNNLAMKLPHLVSLRMYGLKHGGVVLSCPKLAEAEIEETESFHIEVEEAALDCIFLRACKDFRFTVCSPEHQLQSLSSLIVTDCSEGNKHLINDVPCMKSCGSWSM